MNRFFIIIIVALVLASCSNQSQNVSADVAVNVSVLDLRRSSIEQVISATGTVAATQSVALNAEATGKYKLSVNPATGRPFALGDKVNQGQVIVEIEDEEFVINLGLESRKLNLEISEQNYTKQKSLFEKGGVTQNDISSAEVSAINARDNYELAKIQFEKMKVRAPFRGVITSLPYFTNGNKINNGTEVVTLMSYEKMLLEVNMPEKQINQVAKNQKVRITSYTLPADTLYGDVREISPAISTETRTFVSRLSVDNPNLLLRSGMFVQAEIVLAKRDSVIVVPKNVIVTNRGEKYAFIVNQGTAEMKTVTFGFENKDMVEIVTGLKPNDRLVVKGFETLRDRSKVKIVK